MNLNIRRILVLEGLEGIGKTTLGTYLRDKYDWGYRHFAYNPGVDRVKEWITEIEQAGLDSANGDVVVDRLHPSAIAYGELVRGYPDITPFEAWVMDGWLYPRGGKVFYLDIDTLPQQSYKRVRKKFKDVVFTHDLRDKLYLACINREMPKASQQLFTPHMEWAYTWIDRIHEGLIGQFPSTGKLSRISKPVNDQSMGNPDSPRAWLVGERRNIKEEEVHDKRMTASFSGGCGIHLYRALKVARLSWHDIHISNAYSDDNTMRDLQWKWQSLGKPMVVALGNNASDALLSFNIPHGKVWHPQYAKRFHFHDVVGYSRQILEALKLR